MRRRLQFSRVSHRATPRAPCLNDHPRARAWLIERLLKIANGPLYDLSRVQKLAAAGGLKTWTDRCDKTVYELFAGDLAEVADLFGLLRPVHYRDSEWCTNGRNAWAACDAYVLRRSEWVASLDKEVEVEYFLKFAVGKTGQLVLLVSCHLS